MFDFIDGAAGGENGSYNNYHCIERIRLLPRVLNNVVERDRTKPIFDEAFKLHGDFEQMEKEQVKHCPGGKDHA